MSDGSADATNLRELPEVQRWLEAGGYGDDRSGDREAALHNLGEFCAFTGKEPAELITSCMRVTKQGHKAISVKGRRAMQAAIDEYVVERGLHGYQAVAAGNQIRAFLVHNGVFIQGRPYVA